MFEAPAGAQITHASRGAAAAELLAAPEPRGRRFLFGLLSRAKRRSQRGTALAECARCYAFRMMTVRARVKNGRLVVDEPTDLPEGTEVELAAVDADGWTLPEEDRAELRRRMASGERIPAAEALARLRG